MEELKFPYHQTTLRLPPMVRVPRIESGGPQVRGDPATQVYIPAERKTRRLERL